MIDIIPIQKDVRSSGFDALFTVAKAKAVKEFTRVYRGTRQHRYEN